MMNCSTRELQVLDLLQRGLSNKEIAQALGISPYTVRDHISRMLVRHDLPGRVALATVHVQRQSVLGTGRGASDCRRINERRAQPTLQM